MSIVLSAGLLAFISHYEGGHRPKVYTCPKGKPTVGVGFNLDRGDARAKIKDLGLSYDDVRAGIQYLTIEQGRALMRQDVEDCIAWVDAHFPMWKQYPTIVQYILVDLVYNMGASTVAGFKGFARAIKAADWALAALELVFTNIGEPKLTGYWTDTKTRAHHHVTQLAALGKERLTSIPSPFRCVDGGRGAIP